MNRRFRHLLLLAPLLCIILGIFNPQSESQHLQASQLTADGGTFLRLKGKDAGSTLDVTGSDLAGSSYTDFYIDGKKTFRAAELKSGQSSSNKSFGGAPVSP